MAMSNARKLVLIFAGLFLAFVLVLFIGALVLYFYIEPGEPSVAYNSVLVVRVSGELPDYIAESPLPIGFPSRIYDGGRQSLADLLWQLKKAKADRRIGAVLLEVENLDIGWAKADEIRDAIADFRQSGKPIYAYLTYGANAEYYVASACERVYVAPVGDLFINGLAANVIFLRGALDKLGIYPDFYQIGKYKNAPDQLTRREMSEAQREVINSLLDNQLARYINNVAAARKLAPETVRELIDQAPLQAKRAEDAGLIDGVAYRDAVELELKRRLGYKPTEKLRTIKAAQYNRVAPESLGLNEGEKIAVIYASGPIGPGRSNSSPFGPQSVGSETMVREINEARDDQSVRAIVVRIDSPGGTVYDSDLIWHALEGAKEKKPVVISMSDVAASGGYYIAAGANAIVAQPSTITGSIGVFAGKPVFKGLYDWTGVNSEWILRGRYAGLFRETEPFTPDERAKFEEIVRHYYYDEFVPKVAQGRRRDPEYIDSVGQGRVWDGAQARERGLVDEFGGLDRAIEIAKKLANIPADKGVKRVVKPAPRSVFEQLFGNDAMSEEDARVQAALATLPANVRKMLQTVRLFERVRRGELMALMPFELRIE
ncbi:MAG: signal peptide peptidase SppA [Pyrinomonas sp.]|uniref:signal peptide peptidase SppA n=1 Tax=Pyrinomonas sp. TaxID=2080306 RepID=UPI00331DB11F